MLRSFHGLGYDCQWQVLNSKDFGVPQNRERVFVVGHLRGTPRPQVFPLAQDGAAGPAAPTPATKHRQSRADGGYLRQVSPKGASQCYRVYDPKGVSTTLNVSGGAPGGMTGLYRIRGLRIRRLTPLECERLQGFPDKWTEGVSDAQRYRCLGNAVTVNVVGKIIGALFPPNGGRKGRRKHMAKREFTAAEVMEHSMGVCLACWSVVSGGVEPDAKEYECETCGEHKVYGLEEALLMGKILVEE